MEDGLPAESDHEGLLRDERLFSNTMIESMPGILYFYDRQGRFLRWNRNLETVSGYAKEEVAGMHPLQFFRGEDVERVKERIEEVFEKGESSVEADFVTKSGQAIPYFFTGRRVDFENQPCLVGVGIDISYRRRFESRLQESERKYRELVENANSIILRWNAQGVITFMNEFGLKFFGYAAEEIAGRHVLDTIVPPTESNGRDLKSLMEEICSNPKSFEQNVNENILRNGERVWIAWTNRIVYDTRGKVAEILSIGTDVSERKRLENQLRQSQKMDAIGRLAGGVAHDFNNLLTIISGYSHLLLRADLPDDGARDKITAIREASARAAALTRQLLGFSRQTMLQPRLLDMNEAIAETSKMLQRLIGEDIQYATRLAPNLEKVKVDPSQLDQILMNLVVNARDAMPTGGKILIETANVTLDATSGSHLEAKAGPHVMLAIGDTGCGMKPEILSRIFEPFFTTKEAGKGTGLGLAMVFGVVQQSGGGIDVCSEPGAGSTFKLYFPVAKEGVAVRPEPEEQPAGTHGSETILLVEDEEAVRELSSMILKRQGYRIHAAVNGKDALRVAEAAAEPIDLVLTDVVMPNTSGPDMVARLKEKWQRLKVLFMSGYTDDAVVRHGLLESTLAFIPKPYTPEALVRKVREVLDGRPPAEHGPA
ncbi:MAG: PAS domain S-box protein [Planctomycetota bacterium]|nr:PAS domain S-box protein [Planctomycetota bacterium]